MKERTLVTLSDGNVYTSVELVAVQGPNDVELDWPAFYVEVGRPDLASAFKRRALLGRGPVVAPTVGAVAALPLALGGGGLLLGAMVVGMGGLLMPALTNNPERYNDEAYVFGSAGVLVAGIGAFLVVAGLGLATAVAGAVAGVGLTVANKLVRVHPVTDDEIRRLAAEHNARLESTDAARHSP